MSRKPTKGYFVRGHFVADGSELDLELKRELKGDVSHSKTDLKKESTRLQQLGEDLVTLRADLLARLALSEKLLDALAEAKRITNFEGRRRHMQFIGKLMRQLDEETLAAAEAALEEQRKPSARETQMLHEAERWRERLLADDTALTEWMALFPATDVQALRALLRQARKDVQAAPDEGRGQAARQSRSYREVFQLIRSHINTDNSDDTDSDAGTEDADA